MWSGGGRRAPRGRRGRRRAARAGGARRRRRGRALAIVDEIHAALDRARAHGAAAPARRRRGRLGAARGRGARAGSTPGSGSRTRCRCPTGRPLRATRNWCAPPLSCSRRLLAVQGRTVASSPGGRAQSLHSPIAARVPRVRRRGHARRALPTRCSRWPSCCTCCSETGSAPAGRRLHRRADVPERAVGAGARRLARPHRAAPPRDGGRPADDHRGGARHPVRGRDTRRTGRFR